MGLLRNTVKKAVFWTYPRTSWQWDVLCVLILVFIFLTPKSWFENSAYQRSHMGQITVVMSTDVVGAQLDRQRLSAAPGSWLIGPARRSAQCASDMMVQES
jgi:hypothetical protein